MFSGPVKPKQDIALHSAMRILLAVFGLALCVCGVVAVWRSGASRLLTFDGRVEGLLVQTNKAVEMTPDDPEAHSGRALVLLNMSEMGDALSEYEQATALRPRDYFMWLELGRALDLADDERGAIEALRQSASLAPEYAEPRWQLGNLLFRSGQVEEGFAEMKRAAQSEPSLLPNLIDLAWGASGGDAAAVEEVLTPLSDSWKIVLAKFLVRHGKTAEAIKLFEAAGGINEEDRQALLKDLFSARRYLEAYEVWSMLEGQSQHALQKGFALINDGGFEGRLERNKLGFVWQLAADSKSLRLTTDRREKKSGQQSLRIDFAGESAPELSLISQVILVEPNTPYTLNFAFRTEEIVSGGLPLVEVRDASALESTVLGESATLPTSSGLWQSFEIDFKTGAQTSAVSISVRRRGCGSGPCPIYGRVWLDDFAIERR